MSEPTRIMKRPPEGDVARIPSDLHLRLDDRPLHEQFAISLVGSAAQLAGNWVGVSIMVTCVAMKAAPNPGFLVHEAAWLALNDRLPAVRELRRAAADEWIAISDGYAYPTQKLADFVCSLGG